MSDRDRHVGRPQSLAVAVAGATAAAAGCAAVLLSQWRRRGRRRTGAALIGTSRSTCPSSFVPLVRYFPNSSKPKRIERFGEYVVRQLGIPPELAAAHLLAQAADDYVKGDKSRADKSRENLLALAASACSQVAQQDHERHVQKLTRKLIQELDTCMLAYFGFHWHHAGLLIEQVFKQPEQKLKLKDVVAAVMREQRMRRAMTHLRAQQRISMLLEELKVLGKSSNGSSSGSQHGSGLLSPSSSVASSPSPSPSLRSVPSTNNLLVPVEHEKRQPVLLFIGGGMGAGKSTVVREIMKRCFWAKVAYDAVVVEADAFKEKDVIYRALSSDSLSNMARVAELVHEESTRAASSTLVTALNEGRDVIFDGTMSWAPFVEQTIAMARDVHRRRYRLGPGYQVLEDGTVEERYWEPVGDEEGQRLRQNGGPGAPGEGGGVQECKCEEDATAGREEDGGRGGGGNGVEETAAEAEDGGASLLSEVVCRRPYRIELVGVVCDVHLAVVRGMRRAILTKRGVPVDAQLRSHMLFARAIENYCELVDQATVYSTNSVGNPPQLIAMKEKLSNLLVDPAKFGMVEEIKRINCSASNALELHHRPLTWLPIPGRSKFRPGCTWRNAVLAPGRRDAQEELRRAFLEIQVCLWPRSGNGLPTSSTSFAQRK